mgnify:CR=1 FL=1
MTQRRFMRFALARYSVVQIFFVALQYFNVQI